MNDISEILGLVEEKHHPLIVAALPRLYTHRPDMQVDRAVYLALSLGIDPAIAEACVVKATWLSGRTGMSVWDAIDLLTGLVNGAGYNGIRKCIINPAISHYGSHAVSIAELYADDLLAIAT